jgi:hypothetical protein
VPDMVFLNAITHEGLHRIYSIYDNMRMGMDHSEIYEEANRRTLYLQESSEAHIWGVYQ